MSQHSDNGSCLNTVNQKLGYSISIKNNLVVMFSPACKTIIIISDYDCFSLKAKLPTNLMQIT